VTEVYSDEAYLAGYPPGIENHFWHRARNSLIGKLVQHYTAQEDLVLDIGCGPGITVATLLESGVNILGAEQGSAPVLERAKSRVLTETDALTLEQTTTEAVKTVLLLDVIEHMSERKAFLRELGARFPNCDTLIITVPARRELWSDFDTYWGHHLRYDRQQLTDELHDAGYEVERCAYFFNWMYLASLSTKLLRLPRSVHFKAIPDKGLKPRIHGLLAALTRLESALMPDALVGSSLLAVAHPKREH
jgi:SAM-dependent methyltransferase